MIYISQPLGQPGILGYLCSGISNYRNKIQLLLNCLSHQILSSVSPGHVYHLLWPALCLLLEKAQKWNEGKKEGEREGGKKGTQRTRQSLHSP